MQDLIQQPERRSVRNIAIDKPQSGSEPASTPVNMYSPGNDVPPTLPPRPQFEQSGSRSKKWLLIGGGVLLVLILVFVIGGLFAGASVAITPKSVVVNLDGSFTASLDAAEGSVGLEVVEVSKESSRSVAATGQERIERPASGRIVIYNNFDASPQKLIKNTRFQTPEGLIYRIQESVTVPGQHKDATGATVPGSIEATVFADAAGEKYNIGLSDFTIPGFKESDPARYAKFYARSKTPMTGGFSGTVKTASAADTTKGEDEMKAEIEGLLQTEASASLPAGFVLIPESASYSFESLPNTDSENSTVVLHMKGTAKILAINKNDIAAIAAAERISGYTGESVTFASTESLVFELSDPDLDIASVASTSVGVSGPATLVWTFDTKALANDLAGKSRSLSTSIFKNYPGIEKADVTVSPFWKRSFPDAEKIDITIAEVKE